MFPTCLDTISQKIPGYLPGLNKAATPQPRLNGRGGGGVTLSVVLKECFRSCIPIIISLFCPYAVKDEWRVEGLSTTEDDGVKFF